MIRAHVALFVLISSGAAFGQGPAPKPAEPKKAVVVPQLLKPTGPRSYVCYQANEKVTIDGNLDEATWKNIPWSEPFLDIEGEQKARPRYFTRMKMMWDDTNLYVGAELSEPHLWASIEKHDAVIFQDNDFEVFIDPDGDNHNYAELEINALNTTWDLLLSKPYRDGVKADDAFELEGLKTGVKLNGTMNHPFDVDKNWSVEIAIPWKAFAKLTKQSLPPEEGDQWRVNFSRVEWQHDVSAGRYSKKPNLREDNWVWSPQGAVDMHRPERWGYVHFTKSKIGTVRAKYDPTGPARDRLHEVYYAQKAFFEKNKRFGATLDELKIPASVKPPLVMKLTLDGFEATAIVPIGFEEIQSISIRSDSKITVGPRQPSPGPIRN